MKLLVFAFAVTAFSLCATPVRAQEKLDEQATEQSTESPIADMALVDTKTDAMKANAALENFDMKTEKETTQKLPVNSQQHTIADFIIHPLIALKPRVPETESGKQADISSTTPSPWQFFGFNPAQGLGSSVSSLAGSVTGWLGNRIQLPGLVDTPVREPSTTSTTTTTTRRPDVIVRVKQRVATRKPLMANNNDNNGPNRKNMKPNRFYNNNVDNSEEDDDSNDFDDDGSNDFQQKRGNRNRYQEDEEEDDDEEHTSSDDVEETDDEDVDNNDGNSHNQEEDEDEDDEEEEEEKPIKLQNNRRRRPKPLKDNNSNRRYISNKQRKQQQEESAEDYQYDDDEADQDFYYSKNQGVKRSQQEQSFIQRGQQSLLDQIRHFTRGQTPTEVGNSLRKSTKPNNKRRSQQATLIINRNGQTVYVAPELLQVTKPSSNKASATQTRIPTYQYPQPPLTIPYRRKGQPTQYITIPWSQLGISPPDQILSVTEDIQSKPLILNIPQSAIDNMQSLKLNRKRPGITAEAVPLLAEASIMDIFKPPSIPPVRTPTTSKPTKKASATGTPIIIAAKTKPGPNRIRPGTIVEKAPYKDNMDDKKNSDEALDDDNETDQFIFIGDEAGKTGLSRSAYRQILDYFNQNRVGRQVNVDEAVPTEVSQMKEQLIPVQVISGDEEPAKVEAAVDDKLEMVSETPVAMEKP